MGAIVRYGHCVPTVGLRAQMFLSTWYFFHGIINIAHFNETTFLFDQPVTVSIDVGFDQKNNMYVSSNLFHVAGHSLRTLLSGWHKQPGQGCDAHLTLLYSMVGRLNHQEE